MQPMLLATCSIRPCDAQRLHHVHLICERPRPLSAGQSVRSPTVACRSVACCAVGMLVADRIQDDPVAAEVSDALRRRVPRQVRLSGNDSAAPGPHPTLCQPPASARNSTSETSAPRACWRAGVRACVRAASLPTRYLPLAVDSPPCAVLCARAAAQTALSCVFATAAAGRSLAAHFDGLAGRVD